MVVNTEHKYGILHRTDILSISKIHQIKSLILPLNIHLSTYQSHYSILILCRQSKKSEQLEFYFGLNANERYHDGMFFYNADRLVKMYVKEGTMQSKEEM